MLSSLSSARGFLRTAQLRHASCLTCSPSAQRRFPLATRVFLSTDASPLSPEAQALTAQIQAQGDVVRSLKAAATAKDALDAAVQQLLALKQQFEAVAGRPYDVPKAPKGPKSAAKGAAKPADASQASTAAAGVDQKITPRHVDYSAWYNDVIAASDMVDASPVRGCMVIKPWGMAVWDLLRQELDLRIRATGTQNAYFPLFIPKSFLAKEAEHVDGFAKECAVVTHHRLAASPDGRDLVPDPASQLDEPLVVRPTSETIIWHLFGKWITSHRDLPLQVNQWANVVRWEMRTRPFLRTTEFLWQEGHTAHATRAEATALARHMLDVYADVCATLLAVPTVRGDKSPAERFAGAEATFTIEALMQNGWALQSGTAHFLGQNFARAFDVQFQTADATGDGGSSEGGGGGGALREHVWATSWGVSTRLLGALLMTHGDDRGVVLPPRVAPLQVVVVPIYPPNATPAARAEIDAAVQRVAQALRSATLDPLAPVAADAPDAADDGDDIFAAVAPTPYAPAASSFGFAPQLPRLVHQLRVHVDDRATVRPGAKYFEWERRGVPLRLELGPRDLAAQTVTLVARHSGAKRVVSTAALPALQRDVVAALDAMHRDLFAAAQQRTRQRTHRVASLDELRRHLAQTDAAAVGWYLAPWTCDRANEEALKAETKLTLRCYPWALNAPEHAARIAQLRCFYSGRPATHLALFARAF